MAVAAHTIGTRPAAAGDLKRRLVAALVRLEECQVAPATIAAAFGGRLRRRAGDVDPHQVHAAETLGRIIDILSADLTPAGVEAWMRAPNRLLAGDTPRDALAAGRRTDVEAAAESFDDSSYV